ncbi:methyltransferase domain-containing protein [Nocardia halotolerans]|uniref:Methyltransferase domain-containing protein n=1 Tax=Nocardia halotolerans TaxID=1755878 RepID=A0ABV8VMC4_9NOCA
MTGVKDRLLTAIAGQLGNPHGPLGKIVAFLLNRTNKRAITAAVDAAAPATGADVADIGFGGGAGLALLLERVGADGVVHGVEPAPDMLARARSTFAMEVAGDRLVLAAGALGALPLPDASLDAAITVNTIYFLEDLPTACSDLARVLRPGGTAVIGIGDPEAMAKMPFTPYGFRLRPVPEVVAALTAAGFTVDHTTLADPPIPLHLLIAHKA